MKGFALACCLCVSSAALADEAVVEKDESGDRLGRVAAELGAAVIGAALPNLLWVPFQLAAGPFGGPSGAATVMALMAVLLEPLSISTGAYIVHKKMGGKGLWPAALGGSLLGLGIGGVLLGSVTTMATNQTVNTNRTLIIGIAAVGATTIAVVATVFMIELHNDQTVSAAIVPVPEGAVATVGMRF